MLRVVKQINIRHVRFASKYIPPSQRDIQEHQENTKKTKINDRIGKYLQIGVLTLVSGSLLMYYWQPWNPYSTAVSKDLRKGLWEERDGTNDYLKALKHYQDALQTIRTEGIVPQLSLKYTGIVLKLGEMYEKLGDKRSVMQTYVNLGNFIFENLIHGNLSEANPERELLIDRDFVVMTRWAMLKQELKPNGWKEEINVELLDRIGYTENYLIKEKLPWLLEENQSRIDLPELIDIWSKTKADTDITEKWIDSHIASNEGKEFLKCWDVFRTFKDKAWPKWVQSYLTLRDFYAMFLMSNGVTEKSVSLLESNLLWSVIAGFQDHSKVSTQILNIASAWFTLGQATNDIKAYRKSKMIYEKLIEVCPKNEPILPISYYSLGVLYLQIQDRERAVEYFNMAKDLAIELDQIQILDKIDEELLK